MTSENNKRIAKNTLFLSIRMLVVMMVSLYTSRIVLDALGVEDFGIYNVVGGIVSFFAFVNGAMSNATQRYIAFELGKDIPDVKRIFSACMMLHLFVAAFIFIFAESIGLYIVNYYLTIPEDRQVAANWVYQISIISCLVMVVNTPYNGAIVAYERMQAFAYISLIDVFLKLGIAFLISSIQSERLVLYASLIFITQLIIRLSYTYYCRRRLPLIRFTFLWNLNLFKELSGFMGWTVFNNMSIIACTQGVNVVLNMFFNPIVNAARAIAVQVEHAVTMFSKNFQMAITPQIIKSYSKHEKEYFEELLYSSSRLSFFLLLCLAFPILIHVDPILHLWLKEVPEYTSCFTRLIILISLINVLTDPLFSAISALGNIKYFQLISGLLLISILPLSILGFQRIKDPLLIYKIYLLISIVVYVYKLYYVKRYLSISLKQYVRKVLVRIFYVMIFCGFFYEIHYLYLFDLLRGNWIISFVLSSIIIIGLIISIGLTIEEKQYLICYLERLLRLRLKSGNE